jgi:hypothetical protein
LKKYYDDFYYGRHGKFNFLKRYKAMYAVEIVKEINISNVPNKKIIRLKIPHSENRGFRFIESGFGTFIIKSPENHLSILQRYDHKVGIKVIPKIEMPDDESILNKVIFVQTQELVYYLYLYKSYKNVVASYPKDSGIPIDELDDEDEEDEEDIEPENFKECAVADMPHIQVYHKDSKIIQKHRMRKFSLGRAISVAASFNGHFTHNRLIVSKYNKKDEDGNSIPKSDRYTRFFKIYNNFM